MEEDFAVAELLCSNILVINKLLYCMSYVGSLQINKKENINEL